MDALHHVPCPSESIHLGQCAPADSNAFYSHSAPQPTCELTVAQAGRSLSLFLLLFGCVVGNVRIPRPSPNVNRVSKWKMPFFDSFVSRSMVRRPSRRCIQQIEQLGAQFEAGPLHSCGVVFKLPRSPFREPSNGDDDPMRWDGHCSGGSTCGMHCALFPMEWWSVAISPLTGAIWILYGRWLNMKCMMLCITCPPHVFLADGGQVRDLMRIVWRWRFKHT
ncbi:hypothetical protein EDB86DRAFT_1757320 [Lactarius hatsudake]|nr:hypothetical protein EDB86DRAFT_1757320 [Lactarius hatsudake]